MGDMNMNEWGMGFGGMGLLFWIVLILVIAALAKYLFGKSGK